MAGNTKYKNQYIAEKYDRINLTVPKGDKAKIDAFAKKQGKSINGYLNELIRKDMGIQEVTDVPETPKKAKKEMEYYLF